MKVCNACGIETNRYAITNKIIYCLKCSNYFNKEDKMNEIKIDYDDNDIKYDDEIIDDNKFDELEDLEDDDLLIDGFI